MDNQQNKFLAVTYQLHAGKDGEEKFIEETSEKQPFTFLSGFGVAIDAFEEKILALAEGDTFDFVIDKENAYGDIDAERIVKFPKETFVVEGKFDSEHVKLNAQIPLQNEEGQRFWGRVAEIADDHVTIDLNHPLAGMDLHFKGTVIENRDATNSEIQQMIDILSGNGGCGGCGGECGGGGCGGGECGGGDCGNGGCGGCN